MRLKTYSHHSMYNNVFLYWIGKEYKIIKFLRALIYHHSNNGKNYKVHLINQDNILEYIDNFPGDFFWNLKPANQADFVRVSVLNKYGGIWLDSDTIVMSDLTELFNQIKERDGFLVLQPEYKKDKKFCNSVFGTKPKTDLMQKWNQDAYDIIVQKKELIGWDEIGTCLLEKYKKIDFYLIGKYKIFDGVNNLHPVHWSESYKEFVEKPYDNWKKIIRDFQPVIIFNNEVYKKSEVFSESEILSKKPISYFIKKSYSN